jgi:hypothetical protein
MAAISGRACPPGRAGPNGAEELEPNPGHNAVSHRAPAGGCSIAKCRIAPGPTICIILSDHDRARPLRALDLLMLI